MRYPFDSYRITQDFHTGHKALDLVAQGNDEIKASANGVIYYIWKYPHNLTRYDYNTPNNNGGIFVIVRSDTYNQWYYNGHMRDCNVSVGQRINEGHVLGHQGMSGLATGLHDHFEMRIGNTWESGTSVNPKNYIKEENMEEYWKVSDQKDIEKHARESAKKLGWPDWNTKAGVPLIHSLLDHVVYLNQEAKKEFVPVGELYRKK